MNWKSIKTLFLHEMQMLCRDRRTIIFAIVLPVVILPVMLYISRSVETRRKKSLEEITYKYAITGTEAGTVRRLIEAHRGPASGRTGAKRAGRDAGSSFKFEEVTVPDPAASLRSGILHFYIYAMSGAEADALPDRETKDRSDEPRAQPKKGDADALLLKEPTRPPSVPLAQIHYQGDRDDSRAGRRNMREYLVGAIRSERDRVLREKGLALDPEDVFVLEDTSVASAAQATGSQIGKFLTLFLIMFILSGGSVVALDIVAGEKERGSLETLLTTAVRRSEIVAAKQLAILSVGLVIMLINVTNILVYVNFRIIELPADWVIRITPAAAAALICLFVPVAAFLSAVLLSISAYAKSYKEAQLYFFPVYLVSLVPGVAAVLPGVSLRSAIALVPLANVSVAAREVLVGQFDWPMLVVVLAVMVWSAVAMMRASTRMLSRERLITAGDLDVAGWAGGPALFPRHVLAWYAVMGAVLIAAVTNLPQMRSFRAQLLFNELALFLGFSLLMIWRYKLPLREALALRPVKPAVWLAVLAAIPSGHLVATGVFRLADLVVPVPRQVLEQFGREVLPADIPSWQLVFFLAVLPGICEEITFRGTLLYGLRRKFRPVTLALVVGLIFGLFHVALFRIIPTAFLGVVLTAVALLTGSIFPGMILHAGNNAYAYWLSRRDISVAKAGWDWYLIAAVVFAASLYAIYRVRTPYPGLRRRAGPERDRQD
jgi:ABC-type Na+ efflux pump permease subunit/membrane protease YdiL (CAAX protease family)